jgi:LCP family protein required for cell wall assembly
MVREGDTLYSLAERYGTDIETLERVNCLDGSTILIGQRLYVPGPLALPTFATPTRIVDLDAPPGGTPQPGTPVAPPGETPAVAERAVGELPTPDLANMSGNALGINIPDRFLNVVLLGTDVRPDRDRATWRTDTIIVASLDVEDHTVRLLSIPRDLWVYIPGYGYDRINTADFWGEVAEEGGGPETVKRTIYKNLGIPIHYYAEVDFEGFVRIIDTLGGLDIDVVCPLPEMNLQPGMHRMDGDETLTYARKRKSSNDYDRANRQRQVLMALWEQALTPEIILKLPQLWNTLSDNFETDLPLDQAINLAYVGLQLKPQYIFRKAINSQHTKGWTTPQGAMVLLPREEEIRALLQNLYAPLDMARLDAVDKTRLQVLNGWQRNEAARLASVGLRREGFKVVDIDDADRKDHARTQILIYRGDPGVGEQIASQLGVPRTAVQDLTVTAEPADFPAGVDVRIILGQDYDPCQR